LGASVNGIDHRRRRHPTHGRAGRGELAVADHGKVVTASSVRGGGDQLGQRGQRTQALAAPQCLDGGGGAVAKSRGALVMALVGERSDLVHGCGQRAVVQTVYQGRGARHRCCVLCRGYVAGGGTRRHFELGAGRPVQRRTRQPPGAGSDPGEPRQQGRCVGGVGARPKWADGAVMARCPHHRQAWKRLIGQRHPPPTQREPRPAVVRRGMCGQHAQLAHTGLQRMCALDMVDRAGQRHHLLHPAARVGAVEVLTHSASQVDRGADVEHLARRPTEQVNPRPVRQAVREHPFAALGWRYVGQIRAQVGIGVHALVAHSLDQCVQHLDGGAGVVKGTVGGLGGNGE